MNSMFTPRLVKNQSSGSEVGCMGKQHNDLVFRYCFIFMKESRLYKLTQPCFIPVFVSKYL